MVEVCSVEHQGQRRGRGDPAAEDGLACVTEERDILEKAAAYFARECKVKYAFIALHRLQFSVRTMCRLPGVAPSGLYIWLKKPLSRRANENKRQTDLLLNAWEESSKVYGYRKLHDDPLDRGEMCCPNQVARLTRLAGIRHRLATRGWLPNSGLFTKNAANGQTTIVVSSLWTEVCNTTFALSCLTTWTAKSSEW